MLLSALVLFISGSFATAQTLPELYQAAVKNTAAVQDSSLSLDIANYEKRKVYAEVLPTLSAYSTTVWRDQVASAGLFGEEKQHTSYLSLSQPLFQGGSEYYALGIAKRLPKIAALNKHQAEIDLYSRVAEAFYNLFRLGREFRTLEEQEDTLKTRVKTLSKRAKIGRNKMTDVLSAQTQLARVRAERAQTESAMLRAEALLKNITGLSEIGDLKDFETVDSLMVPAAWEQNIEQSPMIRKLGLELETADKELGVANGAFLPSVDVEGRYFLERDGNLRESEWDVSLNASWEIFSSGSDYSDRKVKKLEYERLLMQQRDLKRNLINDYSTLKKDFTIQQATVTKLSEAVKLSKRNYRQHVKEGNQGLVSQLDVLRALADYLEVRRAYEKQIYETKISYIKLKSLAGVRP